MYTTNIIILNFKYFKCILSHPLPIISLFMPEWNSELIWLTLKKNNIKCFVHERQTWSYPLNLFIIFTITGMQEQRKMYIMYSIATISVAFMGIIIQVLKIPQQEYHIVALYFWGDIFNKHKQIEITPTFYRFSLHEKNEEVWHQSNHFFWRDKCTYFGLNDFLIICHVCCWKSVVNITRWLFYGNLFKESPLK